VIRAYAAVNDALPRSLEKLEPLPALLNPRTGKHFGYAVKKDDQGKTREKSMLYSRPTIT